MAASQAQPTFDTRYVEPFLLSESAIDARISAPGRALLREYSCIPNSEIPAHVANIQKRAYALCPYPCIGQLRFLILTLSQHHLYASILARVKQGHTYLDIGCCFAQDIRRLAHDGAPTRNCIGVDLEPGFFALSEQLFLDKGRLDARFFGANIFREADTVWTGLYGKVDIVHASSFFHLFGLAKQRVIARSIVRMLRPVEGSMVLGLQLAAVGEAEEISIVSDEEPTFCHSLETMQELWDKAAREVAFGMGLVVETVPRPVPEGMRIGLLANPKLQEILWVVKVV